MQNCLELIAPSTEMTPNLMQGVLEGLTDGVLILTHQGEWIYHNYYAHCICQKLNQGQPVLNQVPDAIWRNCLALIDSYELYPNQPVVIESEIELSRSQVYRIRVRWLVLEDSQRPYMMVLLEDRSKSIQNQALAEAMLYELTPRQAEVWLLYRAGFSYQQIATELYITLNTVKRHLKDARIKQKIALSDGYEANCVNA
ncbi:MAG: sigma factor-like helix-turn-helix DNA-binding protein [Leptolyngbyaceae cyanobacterium bins.302]|nr:sigma factor-like helix-turn-helix DNA-binding protein [Leptolyngbyaceae cyanobacterium bins.302]